MPSDKENELYRELHEAVEADEPEQVADAAARLLKLVPDDALARELRGTALVRLGQNEEAAEALSGLESVAARFSLAYALYKQLEHARCLELLAGLRAELDREGNLAEQAAEEGSVAAGVLHLEAQVRYRLGEFDVCATIYDEHFGRAKMQEDDELVANRVAADLGAGRSADALRLAAECPHTTFEIEYNAACAMVADAQFDEALAKLSAAEALCRETLGEDDEDLASELAVMVVQRGYVEQRLGRAARAAELYQEALRGAPGAANVAVTANNNIVSLRAREEKVFDSVKRSDRCLRVPAAKMSLEQSSGVRLNRCLLMLNSKKGAECRRLAEELRAEWPARAEPVVALAQQLFREKRHDECRAALREFCELNKGTAAADEGRLALAHVALQTGGGQAAAAAAAAELRQVAGLEHRPAWVATLVALLTRAGAVDDAAAVLDAAVAHWKEAGDGKRLALLLERCAEMRVAAGRGPEAMALFEELVRDRQDDPAVVSGAVLAAARVDLASSAKFARHLPPVEGVDGIDVEALEKQPAPRAPAARAAAREGRKEAKKAAAGAGGDDEDEDDEAAAKKAAKKKRKRQKRVRRPKGFDPENPGPLPDPERWLPRWARKKGRKNRRNRRQDSTMMRGPQGASVPSGMDDPEPAQRAAAAASPATERKPPPPKIKKKKKRGGRRF